MGIGSRSGGLVSGAAAPAAVIGTQTPGDNVAIPVATSLDTRTWIELIDPGGLGDLARGGIVTTQALATGMQNVLPEGQFTLAPIALADGNFRNFQLSAEAWLRTVEQQAPTAEDNVNNVYWVAQRATATATGAWTNSSPVALIGTVGINLKATPGRLRRIRAYNTGLLAWFLQVHNDAAAPINADNSIDRRIVAPGTDAEIDYGPEGVFLSLGVSYAISTQPIALTLIGALEAAIFAEFA